MAFYFSRGGTGVTRKVCIYSMSSILTCVDTTVVHVGYWSVDLAQLIVTLFYASGWRDHREYVILAFIVASIPQNKILPSIQCFRSLYISLFIFYINLLKINLFKYIL